MAIGYRLSSIVYSKAMSTIPFRQPRWLRPFNIFWRVVVVIALGLGAQNAIKEDPSLLTNWRGLLMLLLMIAFICTYEVFERTEARKTCVWPVPYQTVLLYLIVQLAIMSGLLHYSDGFFGPLISLMGHVFATVPMRRWPLPLFAILVLLAQPFGVYEALAARDWGSLIGFTFTITTLIVLAAFIGVLFGEHYKRDVLIAELRQTKADLERYASQAEELAALRERARLARDMHDSLGHALVLVNVKLEAAQRLYAVEAARGDAELEATRALVRETMAELRRSLANLRAPLPDHHDLPAALQRLAHELQERSALVVTCTLPANVPHITPDSAEALWRIAREALANAERHAAAASIDLTLEQNNGSLILRISDDGSGIPPGRDIRAGHYGLVGMRERAAAQDGTLRIEERIGGGTVVEACLPI